jgi:exopolysaccharide production protein ExoQ
MANVILIACYAFIFWLFWKDMRWRKAGTKALIIPGAWIAIQGSRPFSYWLGYGSGESNPVTTGLFALFLVAAVMVLVRRKLKWGSLTLKNKAVFLMYGYLLCSVLWSEKSFDSTKRLVKDFETVLVGLIFLTEINPADAIRAVYVRVSYILFPLSVVFIKYFPDIGREANKAGENMFTGVTTQKNSLGETVFVLGLFLLWDFVEIYRQKGKRKGKKLQLMIRGGMLLMGVWLLKTCDSQTSMLCLALGAAIFWGAGRVLRMRKGKQVLIGALAGIALLAIADKTLGLSEKVIVALGRNPTLTGRTDIWKAVLEQQTDPVFGHGFEIFWDTDRGKTVIEGLMQINSTHNGYLEMYVDGGAVGVVLLIFMMLAGGKRVIDRLFAKHPLGRIGLVFWFLAILYNFSETSYFRLDILWFTLVMVIIVAPQTKQQRVHAQRLAAAASNAGIQPAPAR